MGFFNQQVWVRTLSILTAAVALSAATAPAQQKGTGTFTDKRDGKAYKTVVIGGKKWMAENLSVKTGTSWCYGDQESNCKKYGRLYVWSTAVKMACPDGWHLPTRDEWGELAKAAGGTGTYGAGGTAGTKLKAATVWDAAGSGTDQFGFSALPAGLRFPSGTFSSAGFETAGSAGNFSNSSWWSVTQTTDGKAYVRGVSSNEKNLAEFEEEKDRGFSVRCVEGEATESVIDIQPKKPKPSGGDGKLLECVADENGDCITKFEYDNQNRIVMMYNGANGTNITYTDNLITAGKQKFTVKGNTVTSGKDTMTIDKDGYIVRLKKGGTYGCYDGDGDANTKVPYLAEYQYKDGNVATVTDNLGDCEVTVGSRTEYEYYNYKSPLANCKTPKWLLQYLLSQYPYYPYASKNNVKTIDYGADSFMIILHKYEYDGDGFPIKRTEECAEGSLSCDPGPPTRYIYRGDKK